MDAPPPRINEQAFMAGAYAGKAVGDQAFMNHDLSQAFVDLSEESVPRTNSAQARWQAVRKVLRTGSSELRSRWVRARARGTEHWTGSPPA